MLGSTRIAVSLTVNALSAITGGSFAAFLARNKGWLRVQRWLRGAMLGGLAVQSLAAPGTFPEQLRWASTSAFSA